VYPTGRQSSGVAPMERQAAAGRMAHDCGADPGEYVAELVQAVRLASNAAAELGEHLDSAHCACGGFKGATSPD
jgi:hypothetical protein